MGEVMIILKVFPEEPGKEDSVVEKLKQLKTGRVVEVKKEPLAFGMFVIRAGIVIPDKEDGRMQAVEEEIMATEGVKEVEVEGTTLL